jgi:hypothetical protein
MMAQLADIIARMQRIRAKGKIIHLTPYTAGIIEEALIKAWGPQPPSARRVRPFAEDMPYRIEQWDKNGSRIEEALAYLTDIYAARAAFECFRTAKPYEYLTLRQGALVIAEQLWSDRYAPTEGGRADPAP